MIDRAHKVRGLFVGSYSQVEYLLSNLWVAMEDVSPYFTKPSEFPWKAPKRIKAARSLFEIEEGPLAQFRDRAISLFEEMKDHELNRHVMAHGYMDIMGNSKEARITIRCFRPTKEDPSKEIIEIVSLNQMEAGAKKAAAFAGRWLKLFFDIHSSFGWVAPAVNVASQNAQGLISQTPKKQDCDLRM